ncbi:PH domain-containing protein [Hymenobacter yonginensis]|uniref:PH domain-containing protein n=1 Tax=Hymenobacter yonginensis TaxID=748197 RepID=A0ABY7PUP4_9BACT|nr:PH domain-containing protein [Hymenobacter yonginensis]WBO86635.1 PH domain-containing protein [Hymenobacter yonginensis]
MEQGEGRRFGIETASHLDLDAELKIWFSGETQPSVMRKFNKQVNIYDSQKILAQHVLF